MLNAYRIEMAKLDKQMRAAKAPKAGGAAAHPGSEEALKGAYD